MNKHDNYWHSEAVKKSCGFRLTQLKVTNFDEMKTPVKTIIVDDELHAIDLLTSLINEIPELELTGSFANPLEAFSFVIQHNPDLIFLDIQMPELSGIDFAKKLIELKLDIPVIFVTAYDNFVLEALRVNAVDYLLKPVSFSELQEAVYRVKQKATDAIYYSLRKFIGYSHRKNLVFNTRNGFITFFEDEILFIKADGVYSTIHLKNGKEITVSQNLGKIEEQIDLPELLKIHRSNIVNTNFIFEVNKGKKECIIINDTKTYRLPVSSIGLKLIEELIHHKR